MTTDATFWGLSDEEEALRETTRRFMLKEVEPIVDELEEEPGRHFKTLFPAMGAVGLLGPFLPEEYGGGGGSFTTRAIVAEETARINAGLDASMFADLALYGRAVAKHGTHEQKVKFLAPVISGEAFGGIGITEPSGGSNALSPRTKAYRDGSHWVLNGSKTFITNAPIADFLVVLARTSGEDRQIVGGTWFLLERGMPGFETGPAFDKLGWCSSPTGEVFLNDVILDDDHVLGEPGRGFHYLVEGLDAERVLVGASTVGIAQACLDESVAYATEREVFGKPIAEFQLIQEKLAMMATGIEMTRSMLYRLLRAVERGEKVTREAAILKLYSTQMAAQAATEAVQIHGGYGVMAQSKVARYYRDVKIHEVGAGSSEIVKGIIAREELRAYRSGRS